MNVLSIRIRRPRWFYRNNLLLQWGIIGSIMLIFTILSFVTLSWPFVSVGMIFGWIAAEFFSAILNFKHTSNETFFVRMYRRLKRWWKHVFQAATASKLDNGTPVLVRWIFWSFAEVYDLDGRLIGHKEPDPYDDRCDLFTRVGSENPRRMPLIAWWRTRRREPEGTC